MNSFKAHLRPINCLVYIDETQIILSGSSDLSVRLWTIAGRYIGTLGSPIPWMTLSSTEVPGLQFPHRSPPDIKRIASSTTLKVLQGGEIEQITAELDDIQGKDVPLMDESNSACIYGKPLTEPILGKHFELPSRGRTHLIPVLDKSLPYVSIGDLIVIVLISNIFLADPCLRSP